MCLVRVLAQNNIEPQVSVKITDTISAVTISAKEGQQIKILTDGKKILVNKIKFSKVHNGDSTYTVYPEDLEEVKGKDKLKILPLEPSNLIFVNEKPYRGEITLLISSQGFTVINSLPLEDYLKGVLPLEIDPQAELEALKAQAIVSRTYALANLYRRHNKNGVNFCATTHCQVYGGAEVETPTCNQAVEETQGIVITYKDKLAEEVTYHSTCGGCTENNEDVFTSTPIPYLRSVNCYEATDGKKWYYCGNSKVFQWVVKWQKEELDTAIENYLKSKNKWNDKEKFILKNINILERGISGRVKKLLITETSGKEFVFYGQEIRDVLNFNTEKKIGQKLWSCLFYLTKKEMGGKEYYLAFGWGWGHGVGLCQMGAIGMAKIGYNFEQIICHYFLGVKLRKEW